MFVFIPAIIFIIAFIFIVAVAIKGFKRHSKVEKDIFSSIENVIKNVSEEKSSVDLYCQYCGSKMDSVEEKCSSCGAKKQ